MIRSRRVITFAERRSNNFSRASTGGTRLCAADPQRDTRERRTQEQQLLARRYRRNTARVQHIAMSRTMHTITHTQHTYTRTPRNHAHHAHHAHHAYRAHRAAHAPHAHHAQYENVRYFHGAHVFSKMFTTRMRACARGVQCVRACARARVRI